MPYAFWLRITTKAGDKTGALDHPGPGSAAFAGCRSGRMGATSPKIGEQILGKWSFPAHRSESPGRGAAMLFLGSDVDMSGVDFQVSPA
jgi:hypothetical protein